ncbi:ABC transporter ATP-binding protein [Enterococcus sp. BWT-B8]|uniref:ATP-binding cassette domain-containing protein n=1 Tax=Enterococcus sp. BWT-B8 TaxID=2885157 RepID=UPI001E296FED|nr:ABC transporter ATP-binding protein [Enterococcus sp. BWT-B8]MCB5952198.1 ABC transporter ATP-binding protein [Enterococcus sp. BWT-B8]
MEELITISNLHVKIKKEMIISNLSLSLKKNSINCVVAPNGMGKTTLFKSLVNIIPIESGEIKINLETLKNRRKFNRNIFFLETSDQLFSNLTVYENMLFIAKLWEYKSDLENIIDLVGVESYKNKKIKHLSLGMKQKALIAVAISSGARFIIFDEPINGLDIENIENIATIFLTLKSAGKTILLSSHNIFEISKLCDNIYFLNNGVLKTAPLDYELLKEEYNELYVTKRRD